MNFKIEYSPLSKRLLRGYKNVDSQAINKAIECFKWKKPFCSKDVDGQELLFDEIIINICHNYTPHKYVTFNDKSRPWLYDHTRFLIKKNNAKFQKYLKVGLSPSKNLFLFASMKALQK